MDREAWQATVHGMAKELNTTGHALVHTHAHTHIHTGELEKLSRMGMMRFRVLFLTCHAFITDVSISLFIKNK